LKRTLNPEVSSKLSSQRAHEPLLLQIYRDFEAFPKGKLVSVSNPDLDVRKSDEMIHSLNRPKGQPSTSAVIVLFCSSDKSHLLIDQSLSTSLNFDERYPQLSDVAKDHAKKDSSRSEVLSTTSPAQLHSGERQVHSGSDHSKDALHSKNGVQVSSLAAPLSQQSGVPAKLAPIMPMKSGGGMLPALGVGNKGPVEELKKQAAAKSGSDPGLAISSGDLSSARDHLESQVCRKDRMLSQCKMQSMYSFSIGLGHRRPESYRLESRFAIRRRLFGCCRSAKEQWQEA
jgi:hypothetical protein